MEDFGIEIGERYRLRVGLGSLRLGATGYDNLVALSVNAAGSVTLGLTDVEYTDTWHHTHLTRVPRENKFLGFAVGDMVQRSDGGAFRGGSLHKKVVDIRYREAHPLKLEGNTAWWCISEVRHITPQPNNKDKARVGLKKVILESPFAGDPPANVNYARRCLSDSLHRGEAPLASHLLYTQPNVLDDSLPEERDLGTSAGHIWIDDADLMAVYTDRGVSEGMAEGIKKAYAAGLPVEFRTLPGVTV